MDKTSPDTEEYIQSLSSQWNQYEEYVAAVNEDNLNKHKDKISEVTKGKSILELLFLRRPKYPEYVKPDFKGFLVWINRTMSF